MGFQQHDADKYYPSFFSSGAPLCVRVRGPGYLINWLNCRSSSSRQRVELTVQLEHAFLEVKRNVLCLTAAIWGSLLNIALSRDNSQQGHAIAKRQTS